MAYRKTVNVNLLSESSVSHAYDVMSEALEKLQAFQPMLFLSLLGDRIVEELQVYYPESKVTVDHSPVEGGNGAYSMSVSASGDQLLFIEFGTGFPADESMGLSFGFGAGSWSDDHADTFNQWLQSGQPPEDYPYNHAGVDAFWKVEQKLRGIIKETANEVFG